MNDFLLSTQFFSRAALAACWLLTILIMPQFTAALEPGSHKMTVKASWDGTEQPYYLFAPEAARSGEPMPLLIALHGKGATWESWFAATNVREMAEQRGWVVATPHGRGDWCYLGPGESDVLDTIAAVKELLPIDHDRVYLAGHSMGGWGTWHLGAAHPDLFAAIVPMSGWAPLSLLGNLEHTPPFVIHGDADHVVDYRFSREAVAELAELGVSHRFLEAPGYGHESSMINDQMELIADWCAEHTRAQPARFIHRAYTPKRGKAWFVEILALEKPLTLATIKGELTESGITIETDNVKSFQLLPERLPDHDLKDPKIVLNWNGVPFPALEFINRKRPSPKVLIEEFTLPEDPAAAVAEIMRTAADAGAAAIVADFVALAPREGKLTMDDVLDIYLRPGSGEICVVTLDAPQWRELASDRDRWIPAWWVRFVAVGGQDAKGPVRIAMPRGLAERLQEALPNVPIEATGKHINEAVLANLDTLKE